MSLTDAVKAKSGFAPVFIRRCQNPNIFVPRQSALSSNEEIFSLPDFDPEKFTLFHGVYVGHPDLDFSAITDEVIIGSFKFRQFQIVALASLAKFPSFATTEILSPVTRPPEVENPDVEAILRHLMTGRAPSICLQQYDVAVRALSKNFLLGMQQALPEASEYVAKHIAELGTVSLGELKWGTSPQSNQMLSDAPPPIRDSPEWHRLMNLLKEMQGN